MKKYVIKLVIETEDQGKTEIIKSKKLETFYDLESSEAFVKKVETPQIHIMEITIEQAKYWYSVAKKDLIDGNKEGAWNIYRWLTDNNAWFHAKLLKKQIRTYVPPV